MKENLKRRMIFVNYSLAILAALVCVLIFSLQAAWFVPLFLLFSPWKDDKKNIFSLLGGINYHGSVYSLIPLFQWAQDSAYGFIGISFYQRAKKYASLFAVVSVYQKAKLVNMTFGLSFCQFGKEVFVVLGISIFQKAKDFASVLGGISFFQESNTESSVFLGLSLIQTSEGEVYTGMGVNLFQKAYCSNIIIGIGFVQIGDKSEILLGFVAVQNSQILSFLGCGLILLQKSKKMSEIVCGLTILQKAELVGVRFGGSLWQSADMVAVGKSFAIFRK